MLSKPMTPNRDRKCAKPEQAAERDPWWKAIGRMASLGLPFK